MADVTVDNDVSGFFAVDCWTRWVAFPSQAIGYVFLTGGDRDLYYRKTTDAGATWGSRVAVHVGTVAAVEIWCDWWTAGDSGTKIHISYLDANDNRYYRNLDTASDTLGTEKTLSSTANFTTSTWAFRNSSITKARGGNLYAASAGNSGTLRLEMWRSTDGGANWTSRTPPQENGGHYCILVPANVSDNQDIGACYWDASANEISFKSYDDSGDAWSENTPSSGFSESAAHVQWSAAVRHSDGHIILLVWTAGPDASSDLKVFDIDTSTAVATAKTSIVTNKDDMGNCSVFIDQGRGHLYVVFNGKDDGSETWGSSINVYYVKSTDGGSTWSSAVQINTSAGNYQHVSADMAARNGRFYPVWYDNGNADVLGNAVNSVEIKAPGGSLALLGVG